MDTDHQNRALKYFLIRNCQLLKDWYQAQNSQDLSELAKFEFTLEAINSLNFNENGEEISKVLRLINCLAYTKFSPNELIFDGDYAYELIDSEYKEFIISLMIRSLTNLPDGVLNKVMNHLKSSEVFSLIVNRADPINEATLGTETIGSFVAYFSLITKFSQIELRNLVEIHQKRFFEVAEILMNYADADLSFIDMFFMFTADIFKIFPIKAIFSRNDKIQKLLENIDSTSWNTFFNALFVIQYHEMDINTIRLICNRIDPLYISSKDAVLNFILSKEQNIIEFFRYFLDDFHHSPTNKARRMIEWTLEALNIYISDINRENAFDAFNSLSLDRYIEEPQFFSAFQYEIENLVDFQLTSTYFSPSFVHSYFKIISQINPKPLMSVQRYIQRFALYYYKDWAQKRYIVDYLISFICQYTNIVDWSENEVLNFFSAFFSFIPNIKAEFTAILNANLLPEWKENKKKIIKEMYENINIRAVYLDQAKLNFSVSKLLYLCDRILSLESENLNQFNFEEVEWFEEFFTNYIEIIKTKNTSRLLAFYLDIHNNLKDFEIEKISYEDSKNREKIAKYFLSLIKTSLEDIFIKYLRILIDKKPEIEESENYLSIEPIQNQHFEESKEVSPLNKPNEFSISGFKACNNKNLKEKIPLIVESMLSNSNEYIDDQYWIEYFENQKNQILYLEEFYNSFLYKVTFSHGEQNSILRQFLASHMTRLFNGTLKNVHTNFLPEVKQIIVQLSFCLIKPLNENEENEFKTLLNSEPVQKAFRVEGILNDNICDIVKRT